MSSTSSARFKSAVATARREHARMPAIEQHAARVEQAREFETSRKSLVKRAAAKVVGFFKKAAGLVKSAARKVAATVKTTAHYVAVRVKASPIGALRAPLWFVVDNAYKAGRATKAFFIRHGAKIVTSIAIGAALYIAPATTILATLFVATSYLLGKSNNEFSRFASHAFFRAGVETFADGLAVEMILRNRR